MKEEKNKNRLTFADRARNMGYPLPASFDEASRLLRTPVTDKSRLYNEVLLERRITAYNNATQYFTYPQPLCFPQCLLSFLIYEKELYYRADFFQIPIKIESPQHLVSLFNYNYPVSDAMFSQIVEDIKYFLDIPLEQRNIYELEAYKRQKLEFNIISAHPENHTPDRVLKDELMKMFKFSESLGEIYIKHGIPPFLADLLNRCFKIKDNLAESHQSPAGLVENVLLTPSYLTNILRQNISNGISGEMRENIRKGLLLSKRVPISSKKTFNIFYSNRFFEVCFKEKHFLCEVSKEYSLAPSIHWENIELLELNEIKPLINLLMDYGDSFFTRLCTLFHAIHSNKYEKNYFIFKVNENGIEMLNKFLDRLSTPICLISASSFTNETLWYLTNTTLDTNKVLLFAPEKATGQTFTQKVQSLICGDTINYQYWQEQWTYSYKNSSTVCLIDNGTIDLDFLNAICAPYKSTVTLLEFTDSMLDELLKIFSLSEDMALSMEFFLLLCSFYHAKTQKRESSPLIGKEKAFNEFMKNCCILDDIKDDSTDSWVYGDDLYSAYSDNTINPKERYKPKEFRDKIFEMNYADKRYYEKRHTKTPEGKDRNGRVYYGIQLRPSEYSAECQKIENDSSQPNQNHFTVENIYNFYKDSFTEIAESLKTK